MSFHQQSSLAKLNGMIHGRINWTTTVNSVIALTRANRRNLTDSDQISVGDLQYLVDASGLLDQTTESHLLNLMGWLVVQKYGVWTGDKFGHLEHVYKTKLSGGLNSTTQPDPVWKKCFKMISTSMPHILERRSEERRVGKEGRSGGGQ